MPHAKLTISIPESIWIGELSRAHPTTTFRVLAATANDECGVARVEIMGPNSGAISEEISAYKTVTDVTVFEADDHARSVQIETTVPLLMQSLQASRVPLDLPVEIADGQLTLETPLPQDALSRLGETLDDFGIDFTVEWIRQDVESTPLLTDRQEWLLDEAIKRGYYDTPRRTSLVELAEQLDIAKSTASEMLHRAEERVLKEYREDGDHKGQTPVVPAD